MSVTIVTGVSIEFSETTVSLLNEAKQLSAYRARKIKNEKGEDDFDEFALTEGEEDFFNTHLRYVVPEVFSRLAKIAKGITDSVFIDYDTSTTAKCGFKLVDYQAYDPNVLTVIDAKIRECYTLYILKKWFFFSGMIDVSKDFDLMYREALIDMKARAWSLIKPLMTPGA